MKTKKRERGINWPKTIQQVENCVNERPVCALSDNMKELDHVVPSQFAIKKEREEFELNEWARERMRCWKKEMFEILEETNKDSMGQMVMVYENGLQDEKWTVARVMKVKEDICKLRDENGRYWKVAAKWIRLLPVTDYPSFIKDLEEYLKPAKGPNELNECDNNLGELE